MLSKAFTVGLGQQNSEKIFSESKDKSQCLCFVCNKSSESCVAIEIIKCVICMIRLKRWGMDSYVYAPKDDYKHRAYWRELYTVEEADHLTSKYAFDVHETV